MRRKPAREGEATRARYQPIELRCHILHEGPARVDEVGPADFTVALRTPRGFGLRTGIGTRPAAVVEAYDLDDGLRPDISPAGSEVIRAPDLVHRYADIVIPVILDTVARHDVVRVAIDDPRAWETTVRETWGEDQVNSYWRTVCTKWGCSIATL